MDEQRILEEMERMLAADDPRLAARLAAFGQPGLGPSLRTRRARAALSVMVLVLIAAVAAVIYLMSSLRPGSTPGSPGQRHHSSAAPRTPGTQRAGQRPSTAPVARPGKSARSGSLGHCAPTFAPGCGGQSVASGLIPGWQVR